MENVSAAQEDNSITSRFLKPFPEVPLMEEEEFLKQTKEVIKMPYGQDVLGFKVRIPNDWTESQQSGSGNFRLSEKLFLDLSTFYSKPSPLGRSKLKIEALNLDTNFTAEQWYLKFLLESGVTPAAFVVHDDKNVEALVIEQESDISYYVRLRVMINQSKVIVAKYYVPVPEIQVNAQMQQQVLMSFEFTKPLDYVHAEMTAHRFLDIAEIYLQEGWQVYQKPLRSSERIYAEALKLRRSDYTKSKDQKGQGVARIDIGLIAATNNKTLLDEVKQFKKKIELNGVLVGEKIKEDYEFEYHKSMDFGLTEVYEGIDSSTNRPQHEFWFTVMVGGNYYYVMMLLVPSRNEQFGVWAETTQQYKRIVKEFLPLEGAFLERL
ncbi:MAG: hypothetical protein GC137_09865 [Alphaproteobacteria bacterium]|nr:hypothetical protein [Alphaproteobacteria bacterium]